jgi:hypothetical protein
MKISKGGKTTSESLSRKGRRDQWTWWRDDDPLPSLFTRSRYSAQPAGAETAVCSSSFFFQISFWLSPLSLDQPQKWIPFRSASAVTSSKLLFYLSQKLGNLNSGAKYFLPFPIHCLPSIWSSPSCVGSLVRVHQLYKDICSSGFRVWNYTLYW